MGEQSPPVALVTGVSGSIGGAIAVELHDRGYRVLGTHHQGSSPEGLQSLALDFTSGPSAIDELRSWYEWQIEGSLAVLVHAAGNLDDGLAVTMEPGSWRDVRRVHLDALAWLGREFWSELKDQTSPGHVVAVGSRVGLRGGRGQTNYAAAKAGLVGLVQSLSEEWAPGVLVNLVCPPLTKSTMVDSLDGEALEDSLSQTHTGNLAHPSQTADVVGNLVGQTDVTGQVLTVGHRSTSPW